MSLYRQSGVSVDSWVELAKDVPVRYEVNRESGYATIMFGSRDEYVVNVERGSLRRMVRTGTEALAALETPSE